MAEKKEIENLSEGVDKPEKIAAGILAEDILIILSTLGLFFCWIFKHHLAARIAMWVILVLMVIIFIRRHRRFKTAFSGGKK